MRRVCFFISILFVITKACYSEQLLGPDDTIRFQNLTKEIRCLVCQNQSIADSNAPLAQDLRRKIFNLIESHQSDEAIKNYLVNRYGEFILLKPRFNKLTSLLWMFPALCLIVTLSLFIYFFKKRA